jgi:hypothetical protein
MELRFIRVAVSATVVAFVCAECSSQETTGGLQPTAVIATYTTERFKLHTDVAEPEARATLVAMNAALDFAISHWKRPLRGQLECYLAENVARWPTDALPHPLARVWIGSIGGATIFEEVHSSGNHQLQATIYASTGTGVPEHEVIHAYCCQSFGAMGPDWYKEGMATVACYTVGYQPGVRCPADFVSILQKHADVSLRDVVQAGPFTESTVVSLNLMVTERVDPTRPVRLEGSTSLTAAALHEMRKSYAQSWALCYFLLNNPNYAHRFRRLGEHFLVQQRDSFTPLFGPIGNQLAFEFDQFLQHVDVGYRVDLCCWDWSRGFLTLQQHSPISRRIEAARGYQATGLMVESGKKYTCKTVGQWSIGGDAELVGADGMADGFGRLVGTVFHAHRLTAPLDLGIDATFTAPASGKLYVRCRDTWHQLADNTGSVCVEFSRAR